MLRRSSLSANVLAAKRTLAYTRLVMVRFVGWVGLALSLAACSVLAPSDEELTEPKPDASASGGNGGIGGAGGSTGGSGGFAGSGGSGIGGAGGSTGGSGGSTGGSGGSTGGSGGSTGGSGGSTGGSGGAGGSTGGAGGSAGSCTTTTLPLTPRSARVLFLPNVKGFATTDTEWAALAGGINGYHANNLMQGTESALAFTDDGSSCGSTFNTEDVPLGLVSTNSSVISGIFAAQPTGNINNLYAYVDSRSGLMSAGQPGQCLIAAVMAASFSCSGSATWQQTLINEPCPLYLFLVDDKVSTSAVAPYLALGAPIVTTSAAALTQRLLDIAACRYQLPTGADASSVVQVEAVYDLPQQSTVLARHASPSGCDTSNYGYVIDDAGISLCEKFCSVLKSKSPNAVQVDVQTCN